ncbi:endonuclease/exonuclease/phosphatase family protein [Paenibacillus montanisoli]|uniref:Endonuclease/exonuclease/phosphatase family protein n=1 Tax=Paenibacillus montanisoli TaxID=2081970 RepID=A0A328U2H3_9BACL|nr:endonuclease/exonuclease/phosphatase family protein [Paenibacillus montanisoli]RAP74194.1 endonuclease/exonuclease/phosphatase family protein [Paenibacillus montanisoli]
MKQQQSVKIMTFNTWLGGEAVRDGINKIAKAVELSGAGIVGFQETPEPGKAVAEKLGWHYFQNKNGEANCSVISRFPILEASYIEGMSAVLAHIQLPSGQVILVAVTHLYYDPYGPYWAMFDKRSVDDIIAMENEARGWQMKLVLQELAPHLASDMPLFLMGDFNAPSHLDWSDDRKAQHEGYAVRWPVSVQAEEAGLLDSYRVVHPDPAAMPGITWSTVHTPEHPWGDNPFEPQDRIDFIYYHGSNVKVVSSEVFVAGEPKGFGSHEDNEWPSDHAAVISTFELL